MAKLIKMGSKVGRELYFIIMAKYIRVNLKIMISKDMV